MCIFEVVGLLFGVINLLMGGGELVSEVVLLYFMLVGIYFIGLMSMF